MSLGKSRGMQRATAGALSKVTTTTERRTYAGRRQTMSSVLGPSRRRRARITSKG